MIVQSIALVRSPRRRCNDVSFCFDEALKNGLLRAFNPKVDVLRNICAFVQAHAYSAWRNHEESEEHGNQARQHGGTV